MKQTRLFTSLIPMVIACAAITTQALAWNDVGHIQVADIAWTRLTPQTQRAVSEILAAGDPAFRPATKDETRDAFRRAATFPDFIKGHRDTIYEGDIPAMNARFFKTSPPDPANREDSLCKTWHYYDLPIPASAAHPAGESNAIVALETARAQLLTLHKTHAELRMQGWWLYWIEHLVGDLHQPLHCVSNFTVTPAGDAGGNLFLLEGHNRLHGYWDSGIQRAVEADSAKALPTDVPSVTVRWLAQFAPDDAKTAADLDEMDWVKAGAALAESAVYDGVKQGHAPDAAYAARQNDVCRKQAVLAGLRLAAVLNAALGK